MLRLRGIDTAMVAQAAASLALVSLLYFCIRLVQVRVGFRRLMRKHDIVSYGSRPS